MVANMVNSLHQRGAERGGVRRYLDTRLAAGAEIDRERVAQLVREAGAKAVLSDPDAVGLVRQLWGERAVERLRDRANSPVDPTE